MELKKHDARKLILTVELMFDDIQHVFILIAFYLFVEAITIIAYSFLLNKKYHKNWNLVIKCSFFAGVEHIIQLSDVVLLVARVKYIMFYDDENQFLIPRLLFKVSSGTRDVYGANTLHTTID